MKPEGAVRQCTCGEWIFGMSKLCPPCQRDALLRIRARHHHQRIYGHLVGMNPVAQAMERKRAARIEAVLA